MSYLNGKELLPENLIKEIQKYVDGGYIYIPVRNESRKVWGETKGSKDLTDKRNYEIYNKYKSGNSVLIIANEFFLSPKTVYKIISKIKKSI